ncbi:MAG TPA: lamin tail domain-containing protein [Rubricoccaceae bacterium]|jgi:hypothetical protein
MPRLLSAALRSSSAVRRRISAPWGACALAFLVLTALPAQAQTDIRLVFNEIMANPRSSGTATPISDANGEWLELYNSGRYAIDLRGWTFRYTAVSTGTISNHVIDREFVVGCGQYVVLGRTTDTTANGGVPVDYVYTSTAAPFLAFSNTSGRLALISPDEVVVDEAQYGATSAQDGISRELKNPALNNFNIDGDGPTLPWASAQATAVYGAGGRGTPKAQNSVYTPKAQICGPEPSATSTTSAVAGYRLLSAPVQGLTVGTLVGLNLVQGIEGEFPTAAPNLFTGYAGNPAGPNNGYVVPVSETTPLLSGRGFFWQMYTAGGPGPDATEGASRRAELPLRLQADGVPYETSSFPDAQARFGPASRAGATDQFYLLGNPYNGTFDLSGITASSGTLSDVFQTFEPSTGYMVHTRVAGTADGDASDDIPVWQGFFAEFFTSAEIAAPTLPVDIRYSQSAIVPPGVQLAGRSGEAGQLVGVALDGVTATGARTHDEAAGVYVSAEATDGWDPFDASKLAPLAGPYATVAPVGPGPDGAPRALAQLSVAAGRAVTVPLAFRATEAGRYTLSVRAEAPAGWQVVLTDAATGAVTALGAGASYTFDSEAVSTTDRFVLTVVPDAATAGEGSAPTAGFALAPVFPNPAAAGARTVLEVSEAQHVRAEVVDALGRRVLVLFDGDLAAGARQTLDVGGAGLPVGAYVLRVTGAQFHATRTFSVVR